MVFRIVEQGYLLTMLANKREYPNDVKRPSGFYKIMSAMQKKNLIEIKERGNKKIYRLTNYGWAIACCIAKDFDSPPEYIQFARDVELWIC